jgi:hypothetical protein
MGYDSRAVITPLIYKILYHPLPSPCEGVELNKTLSLSLDRGGVGEGDTK